MKEIRALTVWSTASQRFTAGQRVNATAIGEAESNCMSALFYLAIQPAEGPLVHRKWGASNNSLLIAFFVSEEKTCSTLSLRNHDAPSSTLSRCDALPAQDPECGVPIALARKPSPSPHAMQERNPSQTYLGKKNQLCYLSRRMLHVPYPKHPEHAATMPCPRLCPCSAKISISGMPC